MSGYILTWMVMNPHWKPYILSMVPITVIVLYNSCSSLIGIALLTHNNTYSRKQQKHIYSSWTLDHLLVYTNVEVSILGHYLPNANMNVILFMDQVIFKSQC